MQPKQCSNCKNKQEPQSWINIVMRLFPPLTWQWQWKIEKRKKEFKSSLTSSTLGPSPSSILWASSAFFWWRNTERSALADRLHLCRHHGNRVNALTWWLDERTDGKMDSPTIIRAFNSSWAKSSLPQLALSSPGEKKRKKKNKKIKNKITHLPRTERWRERTSGQEGKASGREQSEWESKGKKNREKGQGAKGL